MSDLRNFARATERSIHQPPFEVMIQARRRAQRRRAVVTLAAAVAAVLALALAIAGLNQLRQRPIPARPAPQLLVPIWNANQIVGNPGAFVVTQVRSRTKPGTVLTIWKRCTHPRPDHDCLGREAIAVSDSSHHRLATLGAVTGSSQQPSASSDGLLREVSDGQWYWAHQNPGPYLVSATMSRPLQLTFVDRPSTPTFGVPSIECPDQVGVCTLDESTRTLARLRVPTVADTRWAMPTRRGCGLWGMVGVGSKLTLVIQQHDGAFGRVDLPESYSGIMAEGGPNCEVAYYQGTDPNTTELVVSLDQGRTWQIRRAQLPQETGNIEQQPHLRALIPPRWQDLPAMVNPPLKAPGPLRPL